MSWKEEIFTRDEFKPLMLQAASSLSHDAAFGQNVGLTVANKLRGVLPKYLGQKLDQAFGDWFTKQSNFMQDADFGKQVGEQVAKPGNPFAVNAAKQLRDNLVTPEMAIQSIDQSKLPDFAKGLARFSVTGELNGQNGLMSMLLGKEYWNAYTGGQGQQQAQQGQS